jgi:hypothetical protein
MRQRQGMVGLGQRCGCDLDSLETILFALIEQMEDTLLGLKHPPDTRSDEQVSSVLAYYIHRISRT